MRAIAISHLYADRCIGTSHESAPFIGGGDPHRLGCGDWQDPSSPAQSPCALARPTDSANTGRARGGSMDAVKRQARQAGVLYVLIAATAWIGLLYVPNVLYVIGDAGATADRIRASEWLLRAGIASELFHQIVQVFLVLALYSLFKGVNEALAQQLVILGALVSVPIVLVNVLNEIAALTLVGGADFLTTVPRPQLDALAYLFLRLHSRGIAIAAIFWGLWLLPFGLLAIRSGFIPRALGILLLVAGCAYVVESTTTLVLPQYAHVVSSVAGVLEFAEVPIILWLAIWGAKVRSAGAAGAS
jgi:hypothetical protein